MKPLQALAALADLVSDADQGVPSPCISVCRMDDVSGLCLGCFRTIDEIMVWGRQDDAGRRTVWRHILQRAGFAPAPDSEGGARP